MDKGTEVDGLDQDVPVCPEKIRSLSKANAGFRKCRFLLDACPRKAFEPSIYFIAPYGVTA